MKLVHVSARCYVSDINEKRGKGGGGGGGGTKTQRIPGDDVLFVGQFGKINARTAAGFGLRDLSQRGTTCSTFRKWYRERIKVRRPRTTQTSLLVIDPVKFNTRALALILSYPIGTRDCSRIN